MSIKIPLDESNFQDLVNGKIVRFNENGILVEIALKDIGFHRMFHCIEKAVHGTHD